MTNAATEARVRWRLAASSLERDVRLHDLTEAEIDRLVAAVSTPTPAGELREVVRREVIEECAKLADGLALSARNAENDASWSREQRSHFAACVVPLQEAAKMIRALAQPGSGDGV